ncbi:transcriptional regulator (DeoR family) protein [Lentisphaera araneosa HTCC2155]|uniref:Transcriptional regulator (DeoR family) protein n=1 Tax=Lentisphaera araneosa HTCC2155 TaxID=313628 RepID=A6DNH4_9BACT|nr:DeoR/GlpR family DNA-binding transcription regulator [Lentisphaera araneosa]EDM26922.1 transcriptional regulator (DeoR family) protein [Lentisphaera araneosa HTCC2155]
MSVTADLRHKNIIDFLKLNGESKVIDLSHEFQVTEETIRRDLGRLENEGKLIRKHGGAILQEQSLLIEQSFEQRQIQNIKEKTAIAEHALSLISEGETIFMDGSTTTWQMSKIMPDIKITVITDSLRVFVNLSNHSNISLISIGGKLWHSTQTLVGPTAISTIQNYFVDKYFFSCQGIDKDWGISDNNNDVASVKSAMIANSNQKILLVDHSKIQKKSLVRFAALDQINHLITDQKCPQENIDSLKEHIASITIV